MFSRTKVINIVWYHLCETRTCVTRARFGRVIPLGRPKSVYKGNVERRFLEFWVEMAKWPQRSRSFSRPAEWISRCIFTTNLMILAQIHFKLSRGQAKFPKIYSQNGQNDLEGQGQWPPFSIPAESITGCMFGANLVNPDQICDKLSHRHQIS